MRKLITIATDRGKANQLPAPACYAFLRFPNLAACLDRFQKEVLPVFWHDLSFIVSDQAREANETEIVVLRVSVETRGTKKSLTLAFFSVAAVLGKEQGSNTTTIITGLVASLIFEDLVNIWKVSIQIKMYSKA